MIRAIVVYYNGKEVPDSTVDKIINTLATDGVATGSVSVDVLRQEDMSKILSSATILGIKKSEIDSDKKTQAACKYIKEKFKIVLSSPVSFAISITNAVAEIKNNGMQNNMLFQAIRVISESGSECCKYGLSSDVINVIKQINESL